jgi:ubiquinol-cytochrome c reductase iron-sulfur subunit
MSDDTVSADVDNSRRKFLTMATAATAAVGGAFTLVPFVASWKPSERARALGAPLELDLSKMEPGQMITQSWRKQPVYVVRRTPESVTKLESIPDLKDPNSEASIQPAYAQNAMRSIKPDFLVLYAACTHLGCLPKQYFTQADPAMGDDWPGGFFCPCHGSKFDLAGRVFNGSPASTNLVVPPHKFESDTMLVIGLDADAAEGVA